MQIYVFLRKMSGNRSGLNRDCTKWMVCALVFFNIKIFMRKGLRMVVDVATNKGRVEAVRAGFKQCYSDKNFADIILVGDRIPQNLLTEDEVLLQYYDIASSKV